MQTALIANPLGEVAAKGGEIAAVVARGVEGEGDEELPRIADGKLEDAGARAGNGLIELVLGTDLGPVGSGGQIRIVGNEFPQGELEAVAITAKAGGLETGEARRVGKAHVPLNVT